MTSGSSAPSAPQPTGSSDAAKEQLFRVGEVARLAGLPAHVLRYWETEFAELHPTKSHGGQRLYSADDIETISRMKDLLYQQGFTIAGARRRLRSERPRQPQDGAAAGPANSAEAAALIDEMRAEIRAILTLMEADDTL